MGSSLLFGKDKNWRNNFVFLIQGREKREIVNLIGKGFLERSSQNWHTLVLSADASSLNEFFRAMNDTMENQAVLDR